MRAECLPGVVGDDVPWPQGVIRRTCRTGCGDRPLFSCARRTPNWPGHPLYPRGIRRRRTNDEAPSNAPRQGRTESEDRTTRPNARSKRPRGRQSRVRRVGSSSRSPSRCAAAADGPMMSMGQADADARSALRRRGVATGLMGERLQKMRSAALVRAAGGLGMMAAGVGASLQSAAGTGPCEALMPKFSKLKTSPALQHGPERQAARRERACSRSGSAPSERMYFRST